MKDMTQGSPTRLLLIFSIPLLIGNLFQQLYNVSDTMIVGRTIGVEALAALGAAVAAKKEELAATAKQQAEEIAKKETKLALLKDSSTKVIGQIDGIIGKLDNILENNGSGNDNN